MRLGQAQLAELGGCGDLLEELRDHRHVQRPGRLAPLERRGLARRALAAPQHPAREHPAEERLHERRAEEVLALVALELEAERLLQLLAQLVERGQVAMLETQARGARVA